MSQDQFLFLLSVAIGFGVWVSYELRSISSSLQAIQEQLDDLSAAGDPELDAHEEV
jgi:hypothetical protein